MDALTSWWRGPRTLGSALTRVLVPRSLMFAAVASMLLVGQAMSLNPTSAELDTHAAPAHVWSLADRAAQPDCVPLATWPEGSPASAVVAQRASDSRTVRVAFDQAWAANHNALADDDLWVVGVCP